MVSKRPLATIPPCWRRATCKSVPYLLLPPRRIPVQEKRPEIRRRQHGALAANIVAAQLDSRPMFGLASVSMCKQMPFYQVMQKHERVFGHPLHFYERVLGGISHFYERVLTLSRTFMSESELRHAHTSGTRAMSARRVLLLNGPVPCDAGGVGCSTDPSTNGTAPFPGWHVWGRGAVFLRLGAAVPAGRTTPRGSRSRRGRCTAR